MKKKVVKTDIQYHLIFGVRKQKTILNVVDLQDIIDSNQQYLKIHAIQILADKLIENGSAVYFKLKIPADDSLSNVVFNLKRNSFPVLYKKKHIKDNLAGEKAIWTRDFAVSIKGEYTCLELYRQLPNIINLNKKIF